MTEDEARNWVCTTFGADAFAVLEQFVGLLLAEAAQQSLIARSTFDSVWVRHIVDSAQLVLMAAPLGTWIDIGSGGGLPGIVAAILRPEPLVMVEPRRKRVEFLTAALAELRLTNGSVVQANVQALQAPEASVISARAVSNLSDLFTWTRSIVSRETQFLLPRGENAVTDLEVARHAWQGEFHVKQSLTDPAAGIVVATQVRPR